jgi:ribosomal protein S12 methylthiotransferase accessory factor
LFDGVYDSGRAAELRGVARFYNRWLGPVTALSVHRPEPGDLPFYSASCRHSPLSGLMRDVFARPAGESPLIPGGGKGGTLAQSVAGALGECAERLLAILRYQAVEEKLRLATYAELAAKDIDALGPAELPLFSPEQYRKPGFRWRPFTAETPLRWIAGFRLLSGRPVLVPAQMVMLWYETAPGEAPIGYPTTGGLAFHTDPLRAVLHGLYEWIERDAINVGWMASIPPKRVRLDLRAVLRDELGVHRLAQSAPLDRIRVFLNTLDVPIPVITVMSVDESREAFGFSGGGGAWSTRTRALAQALFEVAQCRAVLRTVELEGPPKIQPWTTPAGMRDFLDATVFYGYRVNHHLLDWYQRGDEIDWSDVPSLRFTTIDEEWRAICAWLSRSRLDPVVVDLRSASSSAAAVVKVIVPGLTGAWVPADPLLGHPRYREVPSQMGLASSNLEYNAFNQLPLPFA